jgi:SAM-dependent methyltransferase
MTNTNTDFLADILKPYEPQLPIDQLILEVNKLFHEFEAKDYDTIHPEIHQQLPPIWQEMIDRAIGIAAVPIWRILDFGCGTGFEAEQLIKNLPPGSIAELTCYDPSPEMLAYCQAKISPLLPTATFTCDLNSACRDGQSYNLLVTNSLLHHLPDPISTINNLVDLLTPDAIWLAGHEPSSRFYKNAECLKVCNDFEQEDKWKKFLSFSRYFSAIQQVIGLKTNPLSEAAVAAFDRGLFKQKPSKLVIDRIVDFHVAHSSEEADSGRGLDFEIMEQKLMDRWQLVWVKTYSFMGSHYDGKLSEKWSQLSEDISKRFPNDGANFCTAWQRNKQSQSVSDG